MIHKNYLGTANVAIKYEIFFFIEITHFIRVYAYTLIYMKEIAKVINLYFLHINSYIF